MRLMKEDTRRFTRWVELTDFVLFDQAWWLWIHCFVCLWCVLLFYVSEMQLSVISGFRCDADEICALLGYNAASSGNPLPMFRDNVSVPSSRVKKPKFP
jgi:hypothetical protein